MNKTLAWILVTVAVVGGAYYTLKGDKSQPREEVTQEENTGKKMAFSVFAKSGGSYKCEVRQTTSDFESTGTIYMGDGNMRGEFSTIAEGRPMDTSFIYKDNVMYTWSSVMGNTGFKTKADPTASNEEASATGTYSWNTSEIGDYDCVVWEADSSKFELPAGITFKDLESK